MVWSLVFGSLEGRKNTEVLGASLSVSFIFSAGFGKTIGGLVMRDWGVYEFWMPFVSACFFFFPLVIFFWMGDKIFPPLLLCGTLLSKNHPGLGHYKISL